MIDTTTHLLPDYVDLRPHINEVEDQGTIGSCVANTGVKIPEILLERFRDKYPDVIPSNSFSRLYLYYWMRQFEVRLGQQGAYPESLWKVFTVKGVCDEVLWPYDISKQDVQPPTECDLDAQQFKVFRYESLLVRNQLDVSLKNIKHAICQGRPVALSMNVTQDFIDQGGVQHDWKTFNWSMQPSAGNPTVGGHAILAIGYSEASHRILCQNSWGPDWADGGFFGIPYANLGDPYWGVGSAYCSMYDTIGNIPVDDYLPRVWDQMRAQGIRSYIAERFAEITAVAKRPDINVVGDEMDAAMQWEAGTANRLFQI